MRRLASSRTVSTSTDSSPSVWTEPENPRPRRMPPRVVTRLAAGWRTASGWVAHFLTTPAWRRVKWAADRLLLLAVVGAVGWAAVNAVFVAHRATRDRAQADIHLGGLPAVHFSPIGGGKVPTNTAPPTAVLSGARSQRISIAVTNDGADGVTLTGGTLTGPYLSGATKLAPFKNHGFVAGSGTGLLVGTVTADCDAAAPVAHALVSGLAGSAQPATELTVSAKDTNGTVHSVRLIVDTTAFAVQGRMCTR
jgi:hypothetical protein